MNLALLYSFAFTEDDLTISLYNNEKKINEHCGFLRNQRNIIRKTDLNLNLFPSQKFLPDFDSYQNKLEELLC